MQWVYQNIYTLQPFIYAKGVSKYVVIATIRKCKGCLKKIFIWNKGVSKYIDIAAIHVYAKGVSKYIEIATIHICKSCLKI